MISNDVRFTEAWSNHRGFLLDVAYRLLGSYSEAEDTVQEAFTKLLRTDLDPIEDVRAWLLVVLSRQCLDQLRSARVRREAYVGPWFPEPLIRADDSVSDPADVVTLDEAPTGGKLATESNGAIRFKAAPHRIFGPCYIMARVWSRSMGGPSDERQA